MNVQIEMKKLILLAAYLTINSSEAQRFILSQPQVFKTGSNFVKSPNDGPSSVVSSTPSRQYEVPSQLTTPTTFYQVPSEVSEASEVSEVSEVSPPLPSVSEATVVQDNSEQLNSVNSVSTVLSKPGAITSAETDKLFISPAASSLSALAVSSDNKLTAGSSLSAGAAIIISFLLSLIPTLAVSIPFIALRRPIVTRGKRESSLATDNVMLGL